MGDYDLDIELDNGSKTVQVALGITAQNMIDFYGITEEDDGLTRKSKILKKLGEEKFLLEQLGYDPDLYGVEKFEIGAWTTSMKLKNEDEDDKPVIVTNDKIMVTIKRKEHILFDYKSLARDLAIQIKKDTENIVIPKIPKIIRIKGYRDNVLVSQHVGDLHAGGLTHWPETSFDNWDSKRATWVYNEITLFTIQMQHDLWKAKTLLLELNGDILDVDNTLNKTSNFSKHTMQTDSRIPKMLNDRISTIMDSLYKLSPHFEKIIFKVNGGNHDRENSNSIYIAVATSILMSKINNVFPAYDDSALLRESYFKWGKHLFISGHGELKNKSFVDNLRVKYGDLMREHPYINITGNHFHAFTQDSYGDVMVFREPALCPVTSFEANESALNGSANMVQTYKIWEKELRTPNVMRLEFPRKSLWKDQDVDPVLTSPSNPEKLQESFLLEGLMRPTYPQIELARYFDATAEKVKEGLISKGIDALKLTRKDLISLAESMGQEVPIELRTQNREFVIENMRLILGEKPHTKSKVRS